MGFEFAQLKERFVWRRAFRSPQRTVMRADLLEAFDISGTQASSLLSEQARVSGGSLVRDGYKVAAPEWAQPPGFAGEADLMEHLESGLTAFEFTGLRHDELPISYVSWSESLPSTPGVFGEIVRTIGQHRSLYMRYVGMRRGDEGRWRRIVPLCLERLGDQWRVCAQDLDQADFPVRTFVLARLLDCKPDRGRLPKTFVRANAHDSVARVHPEFDARLTQTQREALEYELRVRAGVMQLPSRSVHEFAIRFGGAGASEQAIWPPLKIRS